MFAMNVRLLSRRLLTNLNIDTPHQPDYSLEIYSNDRQLMQKLSLNTHLTKLYLSTFAPGIYLIKMSVMKKSLGLMSIVILVSFILASVPFGVNAQDDEIPVWKKMRYLSEEEMYLPVETGKDFVRSDPPSTPVYNIAEFDYMESVLIRYPLGIPYALIAEMSEDIMVTTIVTGETQELAVRNLYGNNGVNLDNCNFMHAPSDSYWTRDYGPWYIIDGNYEVGIVNFVYNRPRPNDNNIPVKTSQFLDVPLYSMTLTTAGGNYMTDGYGNASSSDLIWEENPGMTPEEIDEMLYEYCGIENNHVLIDPLAEYIKHIDCWGKFLGVNKVLIGEVPSFDPRYDAFEYVADYFASHLSGWGMPWEVFRVYTPGNYPYTPYTNSLILNNKVLVPITGSQWDDEALQVYEDAMPGYEVVGVYAGSSGWQNTDALHCRAKGIADREMLLVRHMPHFGNVAQQEEFEVAATIIPFSGEALYPDSLLVYYKIDDGDWEFVTMTSEDDTTFTGLIPGPEPGSDISYYIHAADESGKSANHPIPAAFDPHVFNVTGLPDITVIPTSIEFLDYQQMIEGIPVMVYNLSEENVVINDINQIGLVFMWYVDPYGIGINLPYELNAGDSLELNIMVDLPVSYPGVILTDTMFIQTNANIHKVLINIDSDLIYAIRENNTFADVHSFPNPFSDQTNIHFSTTQPGNVKIDIFNQQGQKIRSLMDQELGAGQHQVQWDATTDNGSLVQGGIYLYMIHKNKGKELIVRKIILIK